MADQVVVDRWADLLGAAAFLAEYAPSAVVPAGDLVGHAGPCAAGLVGQEAVTEIRVAL
ncbi:hypothetical protein AB0M68_34680 [Streptomyces sp. NPDC051453]|uniref:hypothetical protein n=1 Tax=Streptomyces sp. NPDC051453 TaxID=3154941 RepID=UPI0034479C34